jgi:hypothetical protein
MGRRGTAGRGAKSRPRRSLPLGTGGREQGHPAVGQRVGQDVGRPAVPHQQAESGQAQPLPEQRCQDAGGEGRRRAVEGAAVLQEADDAPGEAPADRAGDPGQGRAGVVEVGRQHSHRQ